MSGALAALQLRFGDRVATLGWNTQHHLEMYYALMGAGMVCHTLNPRLTAAHLAAMINEAENRALAVASSLVPLLSELAPLCPSLEHVIIMDGETVPPAAALRGHSAQVWNHEALARNAWRREQRGAASMKRRRPDCATRPAPPVRPRACSILTARIICTHCAPCRPTPSPSPGSDVLLIAVPMFHANAWGLPFAAPAVGAKLVLPGRHTDGASLAAIMRDEGVTVAAGIQTFGWECSIISMRSAAICPR